MATSERKQRRQAELREQIIAAARDIMLREGYGALTMRRIAEAIDYAPSTLYLYFKDRDEIAAQLCARGYAALRAHLEPAAGVADPRERLRALGAAYLDFALRNPETYRLAFMGEPGFVEAVLKARAGGRDAEGRQAMGFVEQAMAELCASGRLAAGRRGPRLLADTLWVGLHGIASLKIAYPAHAMSEAAELLESLLDGLFDGLMAPDAPGAAVGGATATAAAPPTVRRGAPPDRPGPGGRRNVAQRARDVPAKRGPAG